MDANGIYELAAEYLGACVAALTTTDAGCPERKFLSSGIPAWDCCEQLSVHVGGPSIAPTADGGGLGDGHRIAALQMVNTVALTATIIRALPTLDEDSNPPTPDEMNAAAKVTYADLWSIWNYVASAKRASVLFPPKERELWLEPSFSTNELGGLGGWQIPIRVQLDGYRAYVPPSP